MPAIYYHPEAYSTTGSRLMGRNAAGDSFLRGFFKHSIKSSTLYTQVSAKSHAEQFVDMAVAYERAETIESFDNRNLIGAEQAQNVFHPGPVIGSHACHRALFGNHRWGCAVLPTQLLQLVLWTRLRLGLRHRCSRGTQSSVPPLP